jgi:thiol-disulfide isomerase/thioredoxin
MKTRPGRAFGALAILLGIAWISGAVHPRRTFARMPVGGGPSPVWTAVLADGSPAGSETFKGRVVVLNFWATWCPPCLAEIPELDAFHRRHASSGVVVLGASAGEESEAQLAEFVRRNRISYPVFKAPTAMQRVFGGAVVDPMSPGFPLPNTWVIRRDGTLAAHYLGALTTPELERVLQEVEGAPVP